MPAMAAIAKVANLCGVWSLPTTRVTYRPRWWPDALRWFTGEETALGADDDMLRYFRAHHTAQEQMRRAQQDEEHARYQAKTANNADRKAEALRAQAQAAVAAEKAKTRLHRVRAYIEEEGVTPPYLWPDVISAIESTGTDPDTTEENVL
ncbi:hypothetical protein K373_05986 [Streptomyces sp. DvalAA-21]|nr:hypothetical protein K373_05986 [Streptomyces sp. DvalAA-21]RAJ28209.1 hypothetical protein K351_05814 [Streptomyces sp. DpondAA-E10]RAJ41924.1 hypothetical protein K352_05805 [Streptomyces sp. DpondAA-A50]SCE00402.1 hypothetical protein GA0115235_110625 [Streptomyces sp. DpondAA-F4a]SCL88157.1 hypothetical protein SAMN04883147_102895 [Streptomyces sp. DpondAA-F4]